MAIDPVRLTGSVLIIGIAAALLASYACDRADNGNVATEPNRAGAQGPAVVAAKPDAMPRNPRRDALDTINRMFRVDGDQMLAGSLGDVFLIDHDGDAKCTKARVVDAVESFRRTLLDAGFTSARCIEWDDRKAIAIEAKP